MEVKTFRPTASEFAVGLAAYVANVVQKDLHTLNCGLAKVIPPDTFWLNASEAETKCLEQATTNNIIVKPIKQHLSGVRGTYRVDLVEAKPLSVIEFRKRALEKSIKIGPLTKDRDFWKSISSNSTPAQYGADQVGTLFADHELESGWNLNKIDSILSLGLPDGLGGITTPMLYYGEPRAIFAWHCEDMDFNSVNYLHFGASKVWYAVGAEHAARLEDLAKVYFGNEANECNEFMRHKNIMLSPTQLTKSKIPYCRCVQNPREFMITLPRSYHCGWNKGWNCAESVNFATEMWIPYGRKASFCHCEKYVFQCDIDQFVYEVRQKTGTKRLSNVPSVGELVVIRWKGWGTHLVRIGESKKKLMTNSNSSKSSKSSGNGQLLKNVLTILPINGSGRGVGKYTFDPSLDEWRYPTIRDCTPHVGDVVAVKWKDDREFAIVRVVAVVDPSTYQIFSNYPKKLFCPLVVELAKRSMRKKGEENQRWTFHPREEEWYWPEKIDLGIDEKNDSEKEKPESFVSSAAAASSSSSDIREYYSATKYVSVEKKRERDEDNKGFCCIKMSSSSSSPINEGVNKKQKIGLPLGWDFAIDPISKIKYYFNREKNVSTWHVPIE